VETVTRVARAQALDAKRARDRAIQDALAAEHVRSDAAYAPLVSVATRAALGRVLLDSVKRSASDQGAPTDAELQKIKQERWHEFDRPEAVVTSHFVVALKDEKLAPEARALAERIAEAVRDIKDPEVFVKRAAEFKTDKLDVRAERLPAVTRDGRTFDPKNLAAGAGAGFDRTFAEAAHALKAAGEHTSVVKTQFGFHVILLEERVPPFTKSHAELQSLLRDEVIMRRAQRMKQAIVDQQRNTQAVEIDRAADELMSRVRIVP
jgi:hypothetical protein